jgi:hypothetical protein
VINSAKEQPQPAPGASGGRAQTPSASRSFPDVWGHPTHDPAPPHHRLPSRPTARFRKTALAMQSTLLVEDAPGGGARVVLVLPLEASARGAPVAALPG